MKPKKQIKKPAAYRMSLVEWQPSRTTRKRRVKLLDWYPSEATPTSPMLTQ